MNSEPEITRRNKIFPGPENFGSGEDWEKLVGVSENHAGVRRMKFFNGKDGLHNFFGIVFQPDNRDINQLFGFYIRYVRHAKSLSATLKN